MSLFCLQSNDMSSSFVKRPCSEDTEDDILRQQEEFLKKKCTPSAQAVRVTRPGDKRKSKSTDGSDLTDNVSASVIPGGCYVFVHCY